SEQDADQHAGRHAEHRSPDPCPARRHAPACRAVNVSDTVVPWFCTLPGASPSSPRTTQRVRVCPGAIVAPGRNVVAAVPTGCRSTRTEPEQVPVRRPSTVALAGAPPCVAVSSRSWPRAAVAVVAVPVTVSGAVPDDRSTILRATLSPGSAPVSVRAEYVHVPPGPTRSS